MKTTKTIAGQKITLERGERYIATRPMACRKRQMFPISIRKITHGWSDYSVFDLPAMTYDRANDFLAAFNNGATSFDGRVW